MARGEAPLTKIHFKGKVEDFVIFVESAKAAQDWKADKSIPLTQVVSAFKVFVTGGLVVIFVMLHLCYPSLPHNGNRPTPAKNDFCLYSLMLESHYANARIHRHGTQGTLNDASKATLENEFGTHVEEEVIKAIIEKGSVQETEVRT